MAKVDPIAIALTLATEKRLRAEIEAAKMSGPKGARGAKGDSITGPRGEKGDSITGPKGNTVKGPRGNDGQRGKGGARGPMGIGRAGQAGVAGTAGPAGPRGPQGQVGKQGPRGNTPDHRWKGTKLQIEKPDGAWGVEVDLVGKSGVNTFTNSGGGGGGGAAPQAVILITMASQLAGDLDSSKQYVIDGKIDMILQSIIVPAGGLNIGGHGFNISNLYSSEPNFTLFVTKAGTYSGDLYLTDLEVAITGAGSKVFDLDNQENFNAVEWNTVNFLACTSLGNLTDYRQGLCRNVAWISCADGLTLTGNWSGGWAAVDVIVVGAPMTGVLFRAGAGLLIGGSFRSNANVLGIGGSGGLFCDFAPANITLDAGFFLDGVRAPAGSNVVPNMPASSTKSRIKNCSGIENTYAGGALSPPASGEVVIGVIDTLYQLTPTMNLTEGYWFSVSNTNGLTLDSTQQIDVAITGTLSFAGSINREMKIQLRKYDSSLASYSDIGPPYRATLNGGAGGVRAENVSFHATTNMDQNDRIEVWIKNITDASNITVLDGGQFYVSER